MCPCWERESRLKLMYQILLHNKYPDTRYNADTFWCTVLYGYTALVPKLVYVYSNFSTMVLSYNWVSSLDVEPHISLRCITSPLYQNSWICTIYFKIKYTFKHSLYNQHIFIVTKISWPIADKISYFLRNQYFCL